MKRLEASLYNYFRKSLFVNVSIILYPKLLRNGSRLQQLHIHIITGGPTQVALKYFLKVHNSLEHIEVNVSVIYTWNYLQKLHVNYLLYQVPLTKLKSLLKKHYISLIITDSLVYHAFVYFWLFLHKNF